jgi:hypothetical protein
MISSCNSKKKLNGTWISAYQYNSKDTLNLNSGIPFNELITFNDSTYSLVRFENGHHEEVENWKYSFKNNKLMNFENPEYFDQVSNLTKDNFVIVPKTSVLKRVYKKLDDSLKRVQPNVNLVGMKFIREFIKQRDTLHFINESIYTSSAHTIRNSNGNRNLNWERISQGGFDVIFMDTNIPYVIKKEVNGVIYLSAFDKEKIDLKFNRIE